MRYFELKDDMSEKMRWRWHIGDIRLPDGGEPLLDDGVTFDDLRPLHAEVTHVGQVLQFCLTSFAIPIATQSLADAIAYVAGADVQCIPITIANQTGMVVLNAVRIVQCVDERQSKFVKWTEHDQRPDKVGKYHCFNKLVLDNATIPPDAHFFRIKDWTVALIVSETVKTAMERVGCYGAEFIELEMA